MYLLIILIPVLALNMEVGYFSTMDLCQSAANEMQILDREWRSPMHGEVVAICIKSGDDFEWEPH